MGVDKPYYEGRLQRQLRRTLASKESRIELPKELCKRERWILRALCVMAAVCLAGAITLRETGHPLWMQAACAVQCVFWCALAGLYETASDWQRAASYSARSRNAKINELLGDLGGVSERDAIDMTSAAADFGFATGDEVAEAFRRELGDDE
jgi:hypothetical protein